MTETDFLQRRCEYFLLCLNPADGYVNHIVFGKFPCCRRCAELVDLELVTEESE